MQEVVHLLLNRPTRGQLIQSEQILFQIEVEIRLKIGKTDGVLEHLVLVLLNISLSFELYIVVQVLNDIGDLMVDDGFHVGLDLGLEVVQAV